MAAQNDPKEKEVVTCTQSIRFENLPGAATFQSLSANTQMNIYANPLNTPLVQLMVKKPQTNQNPNPRQFPSVIHDADPVLDLEE